MNEIISFKSDINGHITYLNLEAAWLMLVNEKSVLDSSIHSPVEDMALTCLSQISNEQTN